jgi:hypothetical protein
MPAATTTRAAARWATLIRKTRAAFGRAGLTPAIIVAAPCVPAVAEPPSATGRWLAAGSLDSHLGGARTLILPGRIGPATRESA